VCDWCQFRWPRHLGRRSTDARLLWLRVRIPPRSWLSVSFECLVLSVISPFDGLLSPRGVVQDLVCLCVIGKPGQWGGTGSLVDCRATARVRGLGEIKLCYSLTPAHVCYYAEGMLPERSSLPSFLIWLSPVDWLPWVGGSGYVSSTSFPRNPTIGGWPFVLWFIVCLYLSTFSARPGVAAVRGPSDLLPVLLWTYADAWGNVGNVEL